MTAGVEKQINGFSQYCAKLHFHINKYVKRTSITNDLPDSSLITENNLEQPTRIIC